MNQKTAKLINKYAKSEEKSPRVARKEYQKLPKNKRFAFKQNVKQLLD